MQLEGCYNEQGCYNERPPPPVWLQECCWEQRVLGRTNRPDVSGVSCLHLFFVQLSRFWKTFANKHPSPKLTSWQRRDKSLKRVMSLQERVDGKEREEIRPGMQPSQNSWFFSLPSCKLFTTCLWNAAFFKVNHCLQKVLKYCRSSFSTWFHISSAIWNPGS